MIRAFEENDLTAVMRIWLDTNIRAHSFIPKEYWIGNYAMVKNVLPQAEIYVYEDDTTKQIDGFIGLSKNHVEGLFVREGAQSHGIGKQLLEYAKHGRTAMSLCVYQKNARAIRFYRREQFMIRSEDMDDDTNQKEYCMVWEKVTRS